MTTLHMDLEMVKDSLTKMRTAYDAYSTQLEALNASVVGLQSSEGWLGASATDFFTAYAQVQAIMKGATAALQQLSLDFSAEIAEWEMMAQKLSQ